MSFIRPILTGRAVGEWARRHRERRYSFFVEACRVQPYETILDVGAGEGAGLERFNQTNPIVALDAWPKSSSWLEQPNVSVVIGDVRRLPYADGAFALCFSNSVLQYMVGRDRQVFASEVRRVADRYFVQAPNWWFPVDPHYLVPGIHWLPVAWQKWLNARMSIGWRRKGSWTETRMPTVREMRRLFPDAQIRRERFFGLTKSVMAYRG